MKKATYAATTVSPFIAAAVYTAVALSIGTAVFNPIIAAAIFIGIAALEAIYFVIVKVCEKVNEKKVQTQI
jgi:hypothetical protein